MFHACIRDFERLSPSPGRRRCNLPRERAQFRGIEGGVGVKYVHVRGAWKVMQATSRQHGSGIGQPVSGSLLFFNSRKFARSSQTGSARVIVTLAQRRVFI